jgi:signal peptidase II
LAGPTTDAQGGGEGLDEAAGATDRAHGPASAPDDDGLARRTSSTPFWGIFVGLAAAILVADQVTKAWLTGFLRPGESVDVIGEWLRLIHGRNTGALFGLFRDQAAIFAVVSIGVLGLIIVFHARSGRSPLMSVALGLLLGGALGNLSDRLRLGHVVDFVDAGIGDIRWYTFNVADAAISCALLLLIIVTIRPSLAQAGVREPDGTDREPGG